MTTNVVDIIAHVLGPILADTASRGSGDRARDVIHELWGEGWTFVRRAHDPFDVNGVKPPIGMSYQWMPRANLEENPVWEAVPMSRHPGAFAPINCEGDIELGGLVLAECRKSHVDEAYAAMTAKAHQNVKDWIDRNAGAGLSGHVSIGADEQNKVTIQIGESDAGIVTMLPADLLAYTSEFFSERDRLLALCNPGENESKAEFRAQITGMAIANVRAKVNASKAQKEPVS